MATHPTAIRNGIVNHVVDQLDAGSTNATPRALYQTAADATAATLNMNGTAAFGAASAGVATANAVANDTNAAGNANPVTKVVFTDKDNNEIFRATAGEATGVPATEPEITMSNATISSGDTVQLTSLTYTGPA